MAYPYIRHWPNGCKYTYSEVLGIVDQFVDAILAENGLELQRDRCVEFSMSVHGNGCVNYSIMCDGPENIHVDVKYDIKPSDDGPIDFTMYQIYVDGVQLMDMRNKRYG